MSFHKDLRFGFDFFLSLAPNDKTYGRFKMVWHVVVWTIWCACNDRFFISLSINGKVMEDKIFLAWR